MLDPGLDPSLGGVRVGEGSRDREHRYAIREIMRATGKTVMSQ